ncbi:HEPN domain-containing protein [Olsenella uli]|uniref:HEPN domain-containing protein n=1 Tax=Olsenella uli TaxID=133926 RepID=UPI0028D636A7|nr:HEPN domain-containing protein [Olsenella uli]
MLDNYSWPTTEYRNSLSDLKDFEQLLSSDLGRVDLTDEVDALGKYLIIRSCGHIEIASSECVLSFLERHTSKNLDKYIRSTYKTWASPYANNLSGSLKKIEESISRDFMAFMSRQQSSNGEKNSDTLKQLVDARNRIAHGKSTVKTQKDSLVYSTFAEELGRWYEEYFKPGGCADKLFGSD